jgi:hypothetical protein
MFTVLLITAAIELALYARLRRDNRDFVRRAAQRRLAAQRGPQRLRLS